MMFGQTLSSDVQPQFPPPVKLHLGPTQSRSSVQLTVSPEVQDPQARSVLIKDFR